MSLTIGLNVTVTLRYVTLRYLSVTLHYSACVLLLKNSKSLTVGFNFC